MLSNQASGKIHHTLARWGAGLAVLLFPTAGHPQERSDLDLDQIGRICAGLSREEVTSERGSIEYKDFDLEITADHNLNIAREGVLLSQIVDFTAGDYRKCIVDAINALRVAETSYELREPTLVSSSSLTTEDGFQFELVGCNQQQDTIQCDFYIIDKWEDRNGFITADNTRAVVAFQEYIANEVRLSKDTGGIVNVGLIKGVPFSGMVRFPGVDDKISALAALEIDWSGDTIRFRHVPVTYDE